LLAWRKTFQKEAPVLRTDNPVANPAVVPNLRDVGGLPTESGRRTRPLVLLRSAAPLAGDGDPDGFPWPPAEVVDLRSLSELHGQPHPLDVPDTTVHALPMIKRKTLRVTSDWSDFPDLQTVYPQFMEDGSELLVTMLRIATRASGPVLVHCAAGKDRTGVSIAILLRAAGVTREAVIADYVHTARNMDDVLARLEYNGPEDPTHMQRLMGAPPEAIMAVLDKLDRAAEGGGDPQVAWLMQQGATEEDLDAWRRRMVE
jgi:hypothetical protein